MADDKTTGMANPMLTIFGTCMQMGADMMAFGAKRLEKDVAFQQALLQAKPQDVPHLQMEFWQSVMEDYQEEAGKMMEMAHKAGMPEL